MEPDYKYGIVAMWKNEIIPKTKKDLSIIHLVKTENPPDHWDYINVYNELATNKDFDLGKEMDNVVLLPAPKEVMENFKSNNPDDYEQELEIVKHKS